MNYHGSFGRQFNQAAIDVRAEHGSRFRDFRHLGQAEELEAATVGKNRPGPPHEGVQAPQVADNVFARPQRQMIGVAQHNLRR